VLPSGIAQGVHFLEPVRRLSTKCAFRKKSRQLPYLGR
jgi:hypothetical protein